MDLFGRKRKKKFEALVNICIAPDVKIKKKIVAIEKITQFTESIPYLIAILDDQDNDVLVRSATAQALGNLKSVEAIPHLMESLEKENPLNLRHAAVEALAHIGPKATPAIADLIILLNESQEATGDLKNLAVIVIFALNQINSKWILETEEGRNAILFITKNLLSPLEHIRKDAANVMRKVRSEHLPVSEKECHQIISLLIIALVKGILYHDNDIRLVCSTILDRLSPTWGDSITAYRQIPLLVAKMTDSRKQVSTAILKCLKKIDPDGKKTVLSLLETRIDDHSEHRRKVASDALRVLSEVDIKWSEREIAHNAIPMLLKARVNHKLDIREVADALLTQIDPYWMQKQPTRDLVPFFIDVLLDKNNPLKVRCAAAVTFGKIGPCVGKEVVPHFKDVLEQSKGKMGPLLFAIEAAWDKIDKSGVWRKEMWKQFEETKPDPKANVPWLDKD